MGPGELVRSIASRPVETVRKIPKAALGRIRRALEDRGVIPKPWDLSRPPNAEEMVAAGDQWGPSPPALPGIDLHAQRQLEMLEQMRRCATDLSDFDSGSIRYRYRPSGAPLPKEEALALHLVLSVLEPQRIAELGSGWRELEAGDVLYVDSADRSSELSPLIFEILPQLRAGVWVQLRPVFYPLVHAPLLRAFLMYNGDFRIRFWPSFLHQHHRDRLSAIPQICADSGTLWIRKVS